MSIPDVNNVGLQQNNKLTLSVILEMKIIDNLSIIFKPLDIILIMNIIYLWD